MTSELAALALRLLTTVATLGGYPLPTEPPAVAMVPRAELAAIACAGNCSVNGVYLPERGVLLAEGLDPLRDAGARAILLHELVHHLQHVHGRFAGDERCERYVLREREAYAIENRYRQRIGLPPSYGLTFMMQRWSPTTCAPSPEPPASSPASP